MVNKFIADTEAKIIINKHTGKATVVTGHQVLFMSQTLYDFSGYGFILNKPNRIFNSRKRYAGVRVVDEHKEFDTMFIYCDILDSRFVDNATASLLVSIPNSNRRLSFGYN